MIQDYNPPYEIHENSDGTITIYFQTEVETVAHRMTKEQAKTLMNNLRQELGH